MDPFIILEVMPVAVLTGVAASHCRPPYAFGAHDHGKPLACSIKTDPTTPTPGLSLVGIMHG